MTTLIRAIAIAGLIVSAQSGQAQPPMVKAEVANHIRKVEDGVDQFRKVVDHREDTAQAVGKGRRGGNAAAKKDALDDAMGDLNRSTNRLRRKFDATDKWIETKNDVQRVMDDGRKINATLGRGTYGADIARLWALLRNEMNDLARVYNIPQMAR